MIKNTRAFTSHFGKVFLFGYHGKGNIGDDAICISLIEALGKTLKKNTIIYVYTKQAYLKENLNKENELQIYFVSSFISIFKAFMDSRVIIIDGGDHIHDYGIFLQTSKIFLVYFTIAILTKIFFKKLIIINNGFRAKSRIGLAFLKMILNITYCFSVRDNDSYTLISKYVLKQPKRGFDTAILLNSLSHYTGDIDSKNIGFSITPVFSNFFMNPEKDDTLAKIISRNINDFLYDMKNVNLHFLALNMDSTVGDLNIIRKIMELLDKEILGRVKLITYTGNISDFLSQFSKLDAIICCKYHSIIFSYLFDKPMVVIDYHPKNAALVREIDLTNKALLSLEDVFNGKLGLVLPELLKDPKEFRAKFPVYEAKRRAINGIQKCVVCAKQ